ncbi:MAG: sulfotransferase [Sideroxyarcus sp.]|nr:sulfotransferase [Sideroxyarcus sp.]
MTLPNFMIVGSARCGTTSLYYYLKQHPEIGFPGKKEPKYFSSLRLDFPHHGPGDGSVDEGIVKDRAVYEGLFQGLAGFKRIGEASSDYLYYHQHTASAIREAVGDIPILIVLRDPVERAYSAYNNLLRDQRETLPFAEAIAAEESRLAQNWDWMWAYKQGGLYAKQVGMFLRTFSSVKVVLFEDLEINPQAVVRDLFDFLGVARDVSVNTSTRYSHSGKARNRLVAYLSNRDNVVAFTLRQMALKLVPRSVLEWIASRSLEKEDMDVGTRDELRRYFRDDIGRLEVLLGRSLEVWK